MLMRFIDTDNQPVYVNDQHITSIHQITDNDGSVATLTLTGGFDVDLQPIAGQRTVDEVVDTMQKRRLKGG